MRSSASASNAEPSLDRYHRIEACILASYERGCAARARSTRGRRRSKPGLDSPGCRATWSSAEIDAVAAGRPARAVAVIDRVVGLTAAAARTDAAIGLRRARPRGCRSDPGRPPPQSHEPVPDLLSTRMVPQCGIGETARRGLGRRLPHVEPTSIPSSQWLTDRECPMTDSPASFSCPLMLPRVTESARRVKGGNFSSVELSGG